MYRSEISIDLEAVRNNAQQVISAIGSSELWAVVKANAYGHGAALVAQAALEAGAKALCVATVGEGLELRHRHPDVRIIVMGPVHPREVVDAGQGQLECMAYDEASLKRLTREVPVHIKVNLGLNRWGFSELPKDLPLSTVGAFGHFSHPYSDRQMMLKQLDEFTSRINGISGVTRHVANSSATLELPNSHLDAVRCGSSLLGLSFSATVRMRANLRPVLRWTSYLAQTRRLAPGEAVGYDAAFVAQEPMLMGVVPVGYGDGFSSRLAGTRILVGDEPAQVIGAIASDALAIALRRPAPVGSPVTLVGDGIRLEDHLKFARMTNWELCTALPTARSRIRRRVV
ncbi:alanine racemase [Streptomyces aureocirculatus]|uniref:alanine racemase n=1 Tax=Streptomyces aureocirculatus TaxID=67275 RepID=UPI00099D24A1|nr:alanine racemase [Streptomyces aureocirculatus]